MNEAYTYGDVLIVPKYSKIRSRSIGVDLSTKVGKVSLTFPVISANMKNVTGPKMAGTIAYHGGLGLLHRFCTIEDNIQMYSKAKNEYYKLSKPTPEQIVEKWKPVLENTTDLQTTYLLEAQESVYKIPPVNIGVSIGVKEEDKERFTKLYEAGARTFCIDVAHGHHVLVEEMLKWINNEVFRWDRNARGEVTLIAGNIATADAYCDMATWGADAVKVGIGPSPVCRTRYTTGVGVPQLYALETIYEESTKCDNPPSIIADGGISHPGDISKALKFADAVMIGSMIAGTSETPGDVFRNEDGDFYKVYGGSASGENKGSNQFVEGIIKTVKFKGHVKYIFDEIKQGLESAFSYVGAANHVEFQMKCEFVRISAGAQKESKI